MPVAPPPDRILRDFLSIYRQAELELTRALAKAVDRSVRTEDLSRQLAEATRLRERTEAIVARLARAVGQAVPNMLAEAVLMGGRSAVADLEGIAPLGRDYDSELNAGALNRLARSLFDALTPAHLAVTRTVDDVYKQVIGRSVVGALTGGLSTREASQKALDEFAARGVTGFTDRAGRRWQLDSYAEMAARTATARAAVDAHTDRLAAEDIELVYVSDSPQECPLCRPFEGKVLRISGVGGPETVTVEHSLNDDEQVQVETAGSVTFARAAGLHHPNCTHSLSMFLPGVTRLPTNTENPQGYEDRQKLRYLERGVRKAKRQQAAAITPAAKQSSGRQVRRWQERIRDHVDTSQAKRQPARERPMAGRADQAEQEPVVTPGYVRADREQDPGPAALDAAPQPRALESAVEAPRPRNPRKMRNGELEEAMQSALAVDDFDRFDVLAAESDRRDTAREQTRLDREARDDALAAEFDRRLSEGQDEESAVEDVYGVSVEKQRRQAAIAQLRGDGYTGRGFDELARASFRDQVWQRYADAEDATNGVMVTKDGLARGVHPRSLFTGPESRVRRYASDELREWFDQQGRLTLDEWKAELLGDGAAARGMRSAQGDFLT